MIAIILFVLSFPLGLSFACDIYSCIQLLLKRLSFGNDSFVLFHFLLLFKIRRNEKSIDVIKAKGNAQQILIATKNFLCSWQGFILNFISFAFQELWPTFSISIWWYESIEFFWIINWVHCASLLACINKTYLFYAIQKGAREKRKRESEHIHTHKRWMNFDIRIVSNRI